jgi:hypothetical protein
MSQDKKKFPKCRHCGDGSQTFQYMKSIYLFDIDRAREMIMDGREAIELEPGDVQYSIDECRIYQEHLDHVETKYPGIISHYWYPLPNGTVIKGTLLIDGHHRAARCVRDGLPFFVQILTEEESKEILLKSPDIERIFADLRKQQFASPELVPAS